MELAARARLRVVAPVGVVQWGARGAGRFGWTAPARRTDGAVEVLHPRWLYPPNAGWPNGPLLFLQLLPRLAVLRRRFRWDVIDAHYGHPEGAAAALLAAAFGCPFVVTVRGSELAHARVASRRWLLSWSLRRAARVVALSGELRDLAVALGAAPERVTLIQNGVDAACFSPRSRDEARRRLGLAPTLRIVLCAARLVADKGHMGALDALGPLLASDPDLRLAIAGGPGREGSEFEGAFRARAEAPELGGRVLLLGELSQDALAEWMNAADVFCLASRREGCPNVVLEALACGLPVVATRVGAVPELVPAEEFGTVVPPDDPVALRSALEQALAARWDREAIGAWGRARSWSEVADELRVVFEDVVGRTARSEVSG
jgi:glycosyltransferase involved in cell wall biosynthesis